MPAPQPLASSHGFGEGTSELPDVSPRSRREVTVRVLELADELRADGGIATFHTATGSDFRWFPIADAERDADGALVVRATAVCDCRLTITFAAQRGQARHGYLQRTELDLQQQPDDIPPVDMLGTITTVRLQLPTYADQAGPFRLQRADDRMWLPMLHGTSGLTLKRGRELELQLGPGPYELQDPLHPERSQAFEVPRDTTVVLSETLAPPRDGRL